MPPYGGDSDPSWSCLDLLVSGRFLHSPVIGLVMIVAPYFCRNACWKDIAKGPTKYSNAVRLTVGTITTAGMPG